MTNYSLAVRFLLLSSLLFVISSAQPPTNQGGNSGGGFLSLDCGSSSTSSYTDDNSIVWVGDSSRYIKTGESRDADVTGLQGSVDREIVYSSTVFSTLRVFPIGTTNCYSIDGYGNERVLVRASFFYGNYDNKSEPPSFDLYLNGNYRGIIITSMDDLHISETILPVKGDDINVCLINTGEGLPFISALEVRRLDTGMYGHIGPDYPLYNIYSIAFGTNETVRSPKDVYDRIWFPWGTSEGFTVETSDSQSLTLDDLEDKPPKSVIETAMVPSGPGISSLSLFFSNLTYYGNQIYITAYFSEVFKLNSTQKRSFWIYINSKPFNYGPIIPPYGSALEIRIPNLTPLAYTTFVLQPTNDSTLPPLINAMEVFAVGEKMVEGTNPKNGASNGVSNGTSNSASGMVMSKCLLKTMLMASLVLLVTIHGEHSFSVLGGFYS